MTVCPFCAVGTVAKVRLEKVDKYTARCPQCGDEFRRRRDGRLYSVTAMQAPPLEKIPAVKRLQEMGLMR